MNSLYRIGLRIIFDLLILWAACGMVVFVVLVREGFRRKRIDRFWAVTECPACDGTGWDRDEVCGLCDGDSAIHSEITQ